MKKTIFILLILVICIIIAVGVTYFNYQANVRTVAKINEEYEQYYQKEVLGVDVGTVINKAIDNNEKHQIPKGDKNRYIDDGAYCIKVELKMTDNNKTYEMEAVNNLGVAKFMETFNLISFCCTKIEYHETTKRVKYMLFEQIEE